MEPRTEGLCWEYDGRRTDRKLVMLNGTAAQLSARGKRQEEETQRQARVREEKKGKKQRGAYYQLDIILKRALIFIIKCAFFPKSVI